MPSSPENVSMALFCDFENVALGVRDANYEKFDIKPILERLLLKGSIVVKKAYCDWDRYKGFKATMHEANFELIEIPHVRQSGKNSADIRLVVDALDLCYTKSHVNTFVIISGDSDFSPLVSKLRENAKQVIGVGVKQSTSDLLVANCDEFIFYDDLVRESRRTAARRDTRGSAPAPRRSPDEEKLRKDEIEARKNQALEIALETFDALLSERGESGKIWASVLKEAIKRRKPDFSESYYGFRAFGNLLEEAQARGLLEFGRDDKSGAYVYRSAAATSPGEPMAEAEQQPAPQAAAHRQEGRRKGRGGRKPAQPAGDEHALASAHGGEAAASYGAEPAPLGDLGDLSVAAPEAAAADSRRKGRTGSKRAQGVRADQPASHGPDRPDGTGAMAAPLLAEVAVVTAPEAIVPAEPAPRRNGRGGRKPSPAAGRDQAAAADAKPGNIIPEETPAAAEAGQEARGKARTRRKAAETSPATEAKASLDEAASPKPAPRGRRRSPAVRPDEA